MRAMFDSQSMELSDKRSENDSYTLHSTHIRSMGLACTKSCHKLWDIDETNPARSPTPRPRPDPHMPHESSTITDSDRTADDEGSTFCDDILRIVCLPILAMVTQCCHCTCDALCKSIGACCKHSGTLQQGAPPLTLCFRRFAFLY